VLKGTAVDQDHEVFLSFHKDTIDARLIKGKCSCGNPPSSMSCGAAAHETLERIRHIYAHETHKRIRHIYAHQTHKRIRHIYAHETLKRIRHIYAQVLLW
jgi:hypothetical protein